MVTSRGSGRWVIPKGWLMEGKTAAEAAQLEAWEEAGVKSADCNGEVIGQYAYEKRLDDGYVTPVEVQVYQMKVTETADIFPEARERTRRWVSPSKAAELVDEPSLQAIFRQM